MNEGYQIDQKRIVFKDASLELSGDIFKTRQHIMQISNVTQIWTGIIPKNPLILTYAVVALVLATLFSSIKEDGDMFSTILWFLWGVCIILFLLYFFTPKTYGMQIELASGKIFIFTSKNIEFIQTAYDTLSKILEDSTVSKHYIFDFETGNISTTNIERNDTIKKYKK